MDPNAIFAVSFVLLLLLLIVIAFAKDVGKQQSGSGTITATLSIHERHPLPPLPVAQDEKRAFYLQVHGITHRNDDGSSRQRIIRECAVGEELELVPEPDNPYDSDAIKVCRKTGEQLGYLPSGDGFRFTHEGDLSEYRVTVAEVYTFEDTPGRHGCKLRIAVLKETTV